MKRILMGVLATLIVEVGVGALVVYSGQVDVSAVTPHSPLVFRIVEVTREQSIKRLARDVVVPVNLSDVERVRQGAGNYAAMCVECHLAPGKKKSEIRMGLYPEPPNLSKWTNPQTDGPARQFWIIKHGIKASGMPAWSKGGIEDEVIWDMVAFLQTMPTLTANQYVALVKSSDGHSHGGLADKEGMHESTAHAQPSVVKPGGHDNSDGHAH